MNTNIEMLMYQNFKEFKRLVEIGIISKEIACDVAIDFAAKTKIADYIYIIRKSYKKNIKQNKRTSVEGQRASI